MAYTKHVWECGETITAERMNNIEDGIESASSGGGEALFVRYDHSETVENGGTETYYHYFDKTWQEVHDALTSGRMVFVHLVGANDANEPTLIVSDGVLNFINIALQTGSNYIVETVFPSGTASFAPLSAPTDYLLITSTNK